MEIYVKKIFYLHFLSFTHDFTIHTAITRIAASKTASDDVTYYVTQSIFSYLRVVFLRSFCNQN